VAPLDVTNNLASLDAHAIGRTEGPFHVFFVFVFNKGVPS
jgi:hypothetical protein